MASDNQPSPALAGQYQVVGIVPGVVITSQNVAVDLRTLDLATAQQLVAAGFPYLVPVAATSATVAMPEQPAGEEIAQLLEAGMAMLKQPAAAPPTRRRARTK